MGSRLWTLHWLLRESDEAIRRTWEGAAFATSYRGPWTLIYYEAYLDQADARGREKYLKSGAGRKFLKAQLRHYLSREPIETTA